jgi:hypothetical protein
VGCVEVGLWLIFTAILDLEILVPLLRLRQASAAHSQPV